MNRDIGFKSGINIDHGPQLPTSVPICLPRPLVIDGGSCFGHLSVWLLSTALAVSCRPISHSRSSQDDCACFRCM